MVIKMLDLEMTQALYAHMNNKRKKKDIGSGWLQWVLKQGDVISPTQRSTPEA
jgi:hypothetical protein